MLERDAQRKKSRDGGLFEASIRQVLNSRLGPGMMVVRARLDDLRDALGSEREARRILAQVELDARRPCDGHSVAVANSGMLLALHQARSWQILAAIDSSVSLHSRQSEICFWALALRPHIRYVFVTEDREVYARGRSELGRSCEDASSARRMLETFTDGVFLFKRYEGAEDAALQRDIRSYDPQSRSPVFDNPLVAGHTDYCDQVRPLDDLIPTLRNWRAQERPMIPYTGRLPGDIVQLLQRTGT